MGFTKNPDPAGVGMVLDPIYFDPEKPLTDLKRWRFYFNLIGRYAWITYLAPSEGGPTENGGNQPAIRPYPGAKQGLLGVHLTRVPFSVHLTYYRYFGSAPFGVNSSLDWVNFSFEYRF
jgi:hypothetical protein